MHQNIETTSPATADRHLSGLKLVDEQWETGRDALFCLLIHAQSIVHHQAVNSENCRGGLIDSLIVSSAVVCSSEA